jgi:hypothetical protein
MVHRPHLKKEDRRVRLAKNLYNSSPPIRLKSLNLIINNSSHQYT